MSDTDRDEPADTERETDPEPTDDGDRAERASAADRADESRSDSPDESGSTNAGSGDPDADEDTRDEDDGDDAGRSGNAGSSAHESETETDRQAESATEREAEAATDRQAESATEREAEAATDRQFDEAAIAERIEDRDPGDVAVEIATLRERTEELELDVEDLESRLKRKQAEFENYKKRQAKRREQERERATEPLVERLLEVRDNLGRALDQDADADIRDGVEATFRLLDEVLEEENVDPIEPDPGTEVDPQRHEVLLRVESDQPEGTVTDVHRPGYEMAGKVLRAAQVTVADGGE